MVKVQASTADDFPQWLALAGEVEPLFGPMVDDPGFHEGLRQAIREGTALCAKQEGDPGMLGGIVITREANEILWLAVTGNARGRGVGKALLEEALRRLDPGRPVCVTTFDASVAAGLPARMLYQAFGFEDSQPGVLNPAGIPTVVMVRAAKQ